MYIAILGNHPHLSRAELERVGGNITLCGDYAALLSSNPGRNLGGSSKIGQVITTLDTVDIEVVEDYLLNRLAEDADLPEDKFDLGLSFYGRRYRGYRQLLFTLKKQLRTAGLKPRIVLGKRQEVSTAQVLHNDLTGNGVEILVCFDHSSTYIARTIWSQDIEAYTQRDMGRPYRDMEVGMLPPKLAQIMLNLAGGQHVFDPFCGAGVILQEALLMSRDASGSDIAPRMVEASRANLRWLQEHFSVNTPVALFEADARTVTVPEGVDAIVTEGYLGPMQHGTATKEELLRLAEESSELMGATLENLHPQLISGTPLLIALPAWIYKDEIILPPLVDRIEQLGYNRIRLKCASAPELLYRRDAQYVGRQLILLEKQ